MRTLRGKMWVNHLHFIFDHKRWWDILGDGFIEGLVVVSRNKQQRRCQIGKIRSKDRE